MTNKKQNQLSALASIHSISLIAHDQINIQTKEQQKKTIFGHCVNLPVVRIQSSPFPYHKWIQSDEVLNRLKRKYSNVPRAWLRASNPVTHTSG